MIASDGQFPVSPEVSRNSGGPSLTKDMVERGFRTGTPQVILAVQRGYAGQWGSGPVDVVAPFAAAAIAARREMTLGRAVGRSTRG